MGEDEEEGRNSGRIDTGGVSRGHRYLVSWKQGEDEERSQG